MRYSFTGKNVAVADTLKEKTEQKLNRLKKLLPEDAEVFVTFSKVRHEHKVEVSVPVNRRLLRAEVTANEITACLDQVVDVLEKQIVKYKGRLRERKRRDMSVHIEELPLLEEHEDDSTEVEIYRTKRFDVKPMDIQEAVMEMELLDHSFFVFRNEATDEMSVVYKRHDGKYGLIEPQ